MRIAEFLKQEIFTGKNIIKTDKQLARLLKVKEYQIRRIRDKFNLPKFILLDEDAYFNGSLWVKKKTFISSRYKKCKKNTNT